MIELVEDRLDIDTYLELRQSVQFRELTRDQAKKGLSNSLYTLVAFKDGKAVGMGRIVGDGAIICYVQDYPSGSAGRRHRWSYFRDLKEVCYSGRVRRDHNDV